MVVRQQNCWNDPCDQRSVRSCRPASIRVIASLNFTTPLHGWRRYCGERRALAQAAHSQPHAGTPCAPPVPVSVRVRLMLQRLGEAEVALLVAFTQVKTVCVVALHVGGKLGHFGPWPGGLLLLPMPVIYCRRSDRAPAASPPVPEFRRSS